MRVLVCGSHGFIGRRIVKTLRDQGHHVLCGAREGADVAMDFVGDDDIDLWAHRLAGVDAVINAVGILRDRLTAPMRAIHTAAPVALFEACARQGVMRVIQVSALGLDQSATLYATTKRTADEHLTDLTRRGKLDGVALRPSVVFGHGGQSTSLFLAMAQWPAIGLPREAFSARIQPVHVDDLSGVVASLLGAHFNFKGVLNCVGPQSLTIAALVNSLRAQANRSPAWQLPMPDWITRFSAWLGDAIPVTPWGSETLALMRQATEADDRTFRRILGHPACPPSEFLGYAKCLS